MVIRSFPPVEDADEDGLLAVGGDLEIESLLLAYRQGIFPWPVAKNAPIPWFSPPLRAVLVFDELQVSRSLAKTFRNHPFEISFDQRFEDVIQSCAAVRNRQGQRGTWITPAMMKAYADFHQAGFAHSVEATLAGELVGGLYGVAIGGFFAGESMFYRKANASKCCLLALIEHLKSKGVQWIDCQQLTPLFESLGAREIPRQEFLKLLKKAQAMKVRLF